MTSGALIAGGDRDDAGRHLGDRGWGHRRRAPGGDAGGEKAWSGSAGTARNHDRAGRLEPAAIVRAEAALRPRTRCRRWRRRSRHRVVADVVAAEGIAGSR